MADSLQGHDGSEPEVQVGLEDADLPADAQHPEAGVAPDPDTNETRLSDISDRDH
jgi:hypothetical protein